MQVISATTAPLDKMQLAAVMAKGLYDDPFSIYLFPNAKNRLKHLQIFIIGFINYALTRGHISILIDDDKMYKGGAIWFNPEHAYVKPLPFILNMLQSPTYKLFFYLGLSGLKRFSVYSDEIERAHKQEKKPHYYLSALSVAPEAQGKGYGTQLIKPVMAIAKEQNINCYLETTNTTNHSFYFRNGYSLVHESQTKPIFWTMRAKPSSK